MATKRIMDYVSIEPIRQKNESLIKISWKLTTLKRKDKSGLLVCLVPALDLHFSAKDNDSANLKSHALTKSFFDHYMLHSKNGLKQITLELHKLGYKANDNVSTIHSLINNRPVKAKFKIPELPRPLEFEGADEYQNESKMSIAV